MRPSRGLLLLVLLLGGVWLPLHAQYTEEDEELEDQRLRDEQYYQRHVEAQEEAAPETPQDEAVLVQAFFAKADELIRDKNYRSGEGTYCRIQADDPRADLKAVTRLLDGFREFFDGFWSARTELLAYDEQSRVFLFYSYYKYNQLVEGDWRREVLRPKGHYGSLFDAVVVHTDSDLPGGLGNTLVHESAHQLVDQRLFGGAVRPSMWVAEGLATYYENTWMDSSGVFHAGEVGGKEIVVLRGEPRKGSSGLKERLRQVRGVLKDREAEETPLVRQVISADRPSEFYGGSVLVHYNVSWLLVHYLLHSDDGARADSFVRYLELERRGAGGPDAFFSEIGMSASELDAALRSYVKTVKVH